MKEIFQTERRFNYESFHWETKVYSKCIANGYLLAKDREEAVSKLKHVPYHDKHEEVYIDDDYCGTDGCEIDEDGVAIRWRD